MKRSIWIILIIFFTNFCGIIDIGVGNQKIKEAMEKAKAWEKLVFINKILQDLTPPPPKSSIKEILSFNFSSNPQAVGTINVNTNTIDLNVPYESDITNITPAIVFKGNSINPSSGMPQNFTTDVVYTVYADDGNSRSYTVKVTKSQPNTQKEITSFYFQGQVATNNQPLLGTINTQTNTINVTAPYNTNVVALSPTIEFKGQSLTPLTGVVQDFTTPKVYTVKDQEGNGVTYTVNVTKVAAESLKDIVTVTFPNYQILETKNSFNQAENTTYLYITLPANAVVTSLTPTITINGLSINPTFGTTQNFTNPVDYTVTAQDGTTKKFKLVVAPYQYKNSREILSFNFTNTTVQSKTITDYPSYTEIQLTVDSSANVASLTSSIIITGASISPASGTTKDYTNPVDYTVTAEDGTTKQYKISVVPGFDPRQNLLAYYPCNGNTLDESGYKNHGTNIGVIFLNDRFRKASSCYFNGSTSYISVDNKGFSASINKPTNAITISAWVYTSKVTFPILTKYDQLNTNATYQYRLYLESQNIVKLGYNKDSNDLSLDNSFYPLNYWFHIAVVHNSFGSKVYINSQLVKESTQAVNFTVDQRKLEIGRETYGSLTEYFQGYLNNIRIYDRALSQNEVHSVMNDNGSPPFILNPKINIDRIYSDRVNLSWQPAIDDNSYQKNLQYRLYYSTINNVDTIEKAETNGKDANEWTNNINSLQILSLVSGATYYATLLVRDENGNKSKYTNISFTTKSSDYLIADTGIIYCYDNFGNQISCSNSSYPRQDADFKDYSTARSFAGPNQHSIYTNDYTTTDNVTGLIWQSCSIGQSGSNCGGSATVDTYPNAQAKCTALNSQNNNQGYAGKKDWRLPEVYELMTIKNYLNQTTDSAFFLNTVNSFYWTNTLDRKNSNYAYIVNFFPNYNYPFIANYPINSSLYVKCVSGQSELSKLTSTRYVTYLTSTIKDNHTGLYWQKSGSTTGNWNTALYNCSTLNIDGINTWRLPNVNELLSIVDFSKNNNLIDDTIFNGPYNVNYYTSSTHPYWIQYSYAVHFSNPASLLYLLYKPLNYNYRCVAGP